VSGVLGLGLREQVVWVQGVEHGVNILKLTF
jgi:hypothetical protein